MLNGHKYTEKRKDKVKATKENHNSSKIEDSRKRGKYMSCSCGDTTEFLFEC